MDVLAAKLRERAKELGITHVEVARRVGITDRRYGHYVEGRHEPDLALLVKIAEALLVTPNELLGVSDKKGKSRKRDRLLARLNAAASALNDDDLEAATAAAEAVASVRKK